MLHGIHIQVFLFPLFPLLLCLRVEGLVHIFVPDLILLFGTCDRGVYYSVMVVNSFFPLAITQYSILIERERLE